MDPKARQVVVAYDFSTHGQAVLDRAVGLVGRAPFHVLHFVTVLDSRTGIPAVPETGPIDYEYADRVRDMLTTRIGRAMEAAGLDAGVQFYIHVRFGKPTHEILELAKEIGADLIFIGTHGYTGIERLVMGSVAEHVVREAGCPVMVVRTKTYEDVELQPVVEVAQAKRPQSRMYLYSYSSGVSMRPRDFPIS